MKDKINPYNPITEPSSYKWFNEKPAIATTEGSSTKADAQPVKEVEKVSELWQDIYSAIAHGLSDIEVTQSIVDDIGKSTENCLTVFEKHRHNTPPASKELKSAEEMMHDMLLMGDTVGYQKSGVIKYAEAYHALFATEAQQLKYENDALYIKLTELETRLSAFATEAGGVGVIPKLDKLFMELLGVGDTDSAQIVSNIISEITQDDISTNALKDKTGSGLYAIKPFKEGDGIVTIKDHEGNIYCMYPNHLLEVAKAHLLTLNS